MRYTGPNAATRQAVYDRDLVTCQRCGAMDGPFVIHHRRPRAMGGSTRPDVNSMANLILLDESCHAEVESHRERAVAEGFLVRQGMDPEGVPIFLFGSRWAVLRADGSVDFDAAAVPVLPFGERGGAA